MLNARLRVLFGCNRMLRPKVMSANYTTGKKCEEIRIPVPWGYLAGKWWGPQDKRPILCLHGWQESCGSFDPLVSLLPEEIGYLAIDYPGHGYSSQIPNGMYYHGIDCAVLFRRIQNYFGWEKLSLLGHSMGSITSFMFSCLYPKQVDLLIGIDALKPFSKAPGGGIESTIENIERFLRYDTINLTDSKPPTYTYDEIINKIYLASRKSIALDKCHYVLDRTIQKSSTDPNKYHFSRDNRLKVGALIGMQHDDILEYAKRVTCPMLLIKATKSSYFEDKKLFYDVVDTIKAVNKNFEYIYVEGTHHVHLNEPEKVVVHINKFLEKYNNVDRSTGGIKQEMKIFN